MPRFDVYGRFRIDLEYRDGAWTAWFVGDEGTRRPAPDVPLPSELAEADLPVHLEDVFHEHGAPGRTVRRLD